MAEVASQGAEAPDAGVKKAQALMGLDNTPDQLSTGEALSGEVAKKIVAAFQSGGKVDKYKGKIMDKSDQAATNQDKKALACHRQANDGFVSDVEDIGWVKPMKLLKPKKNPVANIKNAIDNMVKMEFGEDRGSKIEWDKIIDKIYDMKDGDKRAYVAKLDQFLSIIDTSVKAMG